MIKKQYTMMIDTGSARSATKLVKFASMFSSKIYLEYKRKCVHLQNAPESIMEVMSLGISSDSDIHLTAEGVDEHQNLNMLENCLKTKEIIKC